MSSLILTSVICFAFLHCALPTDSGKNSFRGYALFQLYPDTNEKLDFLHGLYNGSFDYEVDFWRPPTDVEEPVEVFVPPTARHPFMHDIHHHQIVYNMTFLNLQKAIEEEKRKAPVDARKRVFKGDLAFHLSQYNSWTEIESYLRNLKDTMPDVVDLHTIGQSHEGRDMLVIRVGRNLNRLRYPTQVKPSIWIDAGIHAREWISPATILYMIDTLLHSHEQNDTKMQRYLNDIDWFVLPVMNPDGYSYTYSKDRMWRKNRSPQSCVGRRCCQGVDLNRNFGTEWGQAGASKNPCSQTYMGSKAFSEPESRAVRDFIMASPEKFKAFLTFHSYGQLFMYPYGYKKRAYSDDMEELRTVAEAAVESLKAVHGTKYKIGTAADILYSASGASEDWAKAEAKIKYSYCIELRPSGFGNGFVLAPRHIVPSGEEVWASVRVIADKIIEKYVATPSATGPNQNVVPPHQPNCSSYIAPKMPAKAETEDKDNRETNSKGDDL